MSRLPLTALVLGVAVAAVALLAAHPVRADGHEVAPSPMTPVVESALSDLDAAIAALRQGRPYQEATRALLGEQGAVAALEGVQGRLEDLYPRESALLQELLVSLEEAAESGNERDVLALAQAIVSTLSDLSERLARYEERPTYVALEPREVRPGQEVTAAVLVGGVPADGFAAYELGLRYDPDVLRVEEVSASLGQGASNQDNQAGTVSVSGFDVGGLLQLGPSAPSTQALAEVRFTAVGSAGESSVVTIEGPALIDSEGNAIPVQGLDGRVSVSEEAGDQGGGAGAYLRYAGAFAIIVVGGAGLVWLRRLLSRRA